FSCVALLLLQVVLVFVLCFSHDSYVNCESCLPVYLVPCHRYSYAASGCYCACYYCCCVSLWNDFVHVFSPLPVEVVQLLAQETSLSVCSSLYLILQQLLLLLLLATESVQHYKTRDLLKTS